MEVTVVIQTKIVIVCHVTYDMSQNNIYWDEVDETNHRRITKGTSSCFKIPKLWVGGWVKCNEI